MNTRKQIYVLGAGGHGKVVISTLFECGLTVDGVLDDDTAKTGEMLLGVPVLGTPEEIIAMNLPVCVILAIGDNRTRKSVYDRLSCASIEWITAIHPRAFVHSSVSIGEGSIVFAGAVIQPDTRVGSHSIVNTGALIDHDCIVGDFCHIAPGCALAGGVIIADGAFLGTGAAVIPGKSVGAWSTAGAGSTIIHDVPSGATVVGTPAKPISR